MAGAHRRSTVALVVGRAEHLEPELVAAIIAALGPMCRAVEVVAVLRRPNWWMEATATVGGLEATELLMRQRETARRAALCAARDACRGLAEDLPTTFRAVGGWRAAIAPRPGRDLELICVARRLSCTDRVHLTVAALARAWPWLRFDRSSSNGRPDADVHDLDERCTNLRAGEPAGSGGDHVGASQPLVASTGAPGDDACR
jgi:hypothetical protein